MKHSKKKSQHKVSADEEQREMFNKNELGEEALTLVHGGVIRPEVIHEAERITQEFAEHQGENVGARLFRSTAYGVTSLVAYDGGNALTQKKKS